MADVPQDVCNLVKSINPMLSAVGFHRADDADGCSVRVSVSDGEFIIVGAAEANHPSIAIRYACESACVLIEKEQKRGQQQVA